MKQQHAIQVFDEDGTVIGDDLADLIVDNQLVVELKTAKESARIEHGLLINFGSYKFEIRKFARTEPRGRGNFRGTVALFSAFFAVKWGKKKPPLEAEALGARAARPLRVGKRTGGPRSQHSVTVLRPAARLGRSCARAGAGR
ncbi:MAG TPA: hypothetical protein VGD81_19795 [Opitutaceae bacterium]